MSKEPGHFGVDIGTTEVRAVVGEITGTTRWRSSASVELRRGAFVRAWWSTLRHGAIKHAVEEAEMMSGLPIDSAYVGLGGVRVRGINRAA
jgi:cell division protein FtsA